MESSQCQVCGAFFIDKNSLDQHIDVVHTKEELYSCILCLKTTLVQLVGQSRPLANGHNSPAKLDNQDTDCNGETEKQEQMSQYGKGSCDENSTGDHESVNQGMTSENDDSSGHLKNAYENGYYLNDGQNAFDYKNVNMGSPCRDDNFALSDQLDNENYTQSIDGNGFVCRFCHKMFTTKYTLKRHLMSHNDDRPNKCDVCGKAFIGKQNLQTHYRIHTGEKPYDCQYCHKKFTQYGTLYRHAQTHLKDRLGGIDSHGAGNDGILSMNELKESEEIKDSNENQNLMFSGNNEKMNENEFSEKHVSLVDLSMENDSSSDGENRKLNNSVRSESQHGSDHVQFGSSHKRKDVLSSTYDHIDDIATLKTSNNFSLVQKIDDFDNNKQELTETVTGKGDNSRMEEIKRLHEKQNDHLENEIVNYQVSNENGYFYQGTKLSADVVSDVERSRSLIGDELKMPSNEKMDTSRTHFVEERKKTPGNLLCDICNITFDSIESLDSHLILHRNGNLHMCLVCGKGFAMGYTLRRHMMIHSGEKPHKCDICGKGFIEKQHLQAHYRIHTGEKPYKCNVCEKKFTQYGTLHNHLQTHKNRESSPKGDKTGTVSPKGNIVSPKGNTVSPKGNTVSPKGNKMEMVSPTNDKIEEIHSQNLTGYNTKFDSGDMYIKQEVLSDDEDCGIVADTKESTMETEQKSTNGDPAHEFQSPDKDINLENYKLESLQSDRKSEVDLLVNFSQNVQHLPIKTESCDVETPGMTPLMSSFAVSDTGRNLLSAYQDNNFLYSSMNHNTGNQLPGIASFTSNRSNLLMNFHLTCNFCLQVFTSAGDLQAHMQIHLNNFNNSMMSSQLHTPEFSTKENSDETEDKNDKLNPDRIEILNDTKNDKPHKCTVCGKGYQAKYCLRRHMYVHYGEKPFKCQICGRGFIEKQHLTIHFRIHTGEKPYECKFCGKKFTQYGTLHNHLNIHKRKGSCTSRKAEKNLQNSRQLANQNEVDLEREHQPNSYNIDISDSNHAGQSQNQNNRETEKGASQNVEFSDYNHNHEGIESRPNSADKYEGKYKTEIQNGEIGHGFSQNQQQTEKFFKTENSENDEGTFQSEEKSLFAYTCEICNETFYSKQNWKAHKRIHHSDVTCRCDVCGKNFSSENVLKRHSMIHSGIRPHKCDICGKGFMEKQHLQIHRRIHTGEKPYKCNICDKRFTQYGTLHKHNRIHTKDKPYSCQYCSKSFAERRQLVHHMASHKDMLETVS